MKILLNTNRYQNIYTKKTGASLAFGRKSGTNVPLREHSVQMPCPKKTIVTKAECFDYVDEILLKAKSPDEMNAAAKKAARAIDGVLQKEAQNLHKITAGAKEKAEDEWSLIRKFPRNTGKTNRKITEHGGTVIIEEDGPFDTKNITEFENGVLKSFTEGYQASKDSTAEAERILTFWPNGNLMHYLKGHKESPNQRSLNMEMFFDPDGRIGLYRENVKECNNVPVKMKRSVKFQSGKIKRYIKNYTLENIETPKTETEIKFAKGKPVFVSINDRVLFEFDK